MATFSAVTRHHVLQAIAEYDARGADDFLGVYGFGDAHGYPLVHEGRTYDSAAVLGVAHRYATGRLATVGEFGGGVHGAVSVLRKRGFTVEEPASAPRPAPAPATRTRRAATPRAGTSTRTAAPERVAPLCPTCSMTLPGTGICDYCA